MAYQTCTECHDTTDLSVRGSCQTCEGMGYIEVEVQPEPIRPINDSAEAERRITEGIEKGSGKLTSAEKAVFLQAGMDAVEHARSNGGFLTSDDLHPYLDPDFVEACGDTRGIMGATMRRLAKLGYIEPVIGDYGNQVTQKSERTVANSAPKNLWRVR